MSADLQVAPPPGPARNRPLTGQHSCRQPAKVIVVKHKRVYRLYKIANLAVRRRKKVKRPPNERVPLQIARKVNDVWSMDFVSDSLSNGRRIKCLTVADDFSHECVDIAVDFGISGQYVTRLLDQAAIFRG